jgi:hypothetical protein
MNRPTDDPKKHLLQLRVSDDFLNAVEDWRARQRPIPSLSEAVRQLTMTALATPQSTVKPKGRKK